MDGLGNLATMPILDLLEADLPPPGPFLRCAKLDSIKAIKKAVARRYKIKVADLEGPSRREIYSKPRQISMALSYRKLKPLGYSLPMIGRHFGGRDHTTILHAVRKFKAIKIRPGASSAWSSPPPLRLIQKMELAA